MVEKSPATRFWPSFYEPFRALGSKFGEWLAPAADAMSDEKSYRISMELPGVAEKDIDITVGDGVVTVRGEKRTEREESGKTWYFSERQFGSFSRSFQLPADADPAKVSADLKEGVLTLTIGKAAPEASPKHRKVPIGTPA